MEPVADTYALALRTLASTPTALAALLEPLSADDWTRAPAPGEWSPQDMMTHLLHVETAVIPTRVRQMLEADGAPLVSPEPADTQSHPATATELLAVWRAARLDNLTFLRSLTPAQLAQTGEHRDYGRISAQEHITEWAYHDLEHLRQLLATVEARLYPAIGGFRALYQPPYPLDDSSR